MLYPVLSAVDPGRGAAGLQVEALTMAGDQAWEQIKANSRMIETGDRTLVTISA